MCLNAAYYRRYMRCSLTAVHAPMPVALGPIGIAGLGLRDLEAFDRDSRALVDEHTAVRVDLRGGIEVGALVG